MASSKRNRPARKPHGLIGSALAGLGLLSLVTGATGQGVPLGAAQNVAIASYAGVTNTGPSIVNGNIALSPLITITGFSVSNPPGPGIVTGTVHYNDTPAQNARADAMTAYNTLAGQAYLPANDKTGVDLGGLTLTPGVYHFNTSAGLTGALTLNTLGDPNAVFIFQIGSSLTTATGSSVVVAGGGTPNIYWQVGSSATLNSTTAFDGNILALASVTMKTNASLANGRAIALNGSVTMESNGISSPAALNTPALGRFWNGSASNLWSGTNWSDNVNASNPPVPLGANVDVTFSVNPTLIPTPIPIHQSTLLGGDQMISSLTVNDTAPVTIGGPGTLTLRTTGQLTGINVNSGAGLTTISSNLVLSDLSSQVVTVNNAAGMLISGVVRDVVGGSNGLTKAGTGVLTLTGANTYTGATEVTSGTMLAGNVSAFGSGVLVINGGVVDTYKSQVLGMNVGGYVQNGGQIRMDLEGTTPDKYTHFNVLEPIDPTVPPVLRGGTVFVYNLSGNYVPYGAWVGNPSGDVQKIVQTSHGLSGQFASNSPTSDFYNAAFNVDFHYHQGDTLLYPTLTYDPLNAKVTWVQRPFDSLPGLTANQAAVGAALNTFQSNNPVDPAGMITYLDGLPIATLPDLYNSLMPGDLTAMFQIGFAGADMQNANIERHLELVRQAPQGYTPPPSTTRSKDSKGGVVESAPVMTREDKRWSFFLEGSGEFSRVNGDLNAFGYDFNTERVTVGADLRVSENFAVGIMGSYAESNADLAHGGSIDVNTGKVAVYATVFGNGFYLDGLIGAGYNSYDTTRAGLLGYANGSTNGWELDTLLNGGYDIHQGDWTYGLTASVAYTRVQFDSFTESGSLAPLGYPSQEQESLRTNLGARIAYTATMGGMKVTPQVRVSWQHEFLDSTQSMRSQFAFGNSPMFTVDGPNMGRDSALISAGVNLQVTSTLNIYAYYDGQVGRSNYVSNNVSLGLKYDF